MNRKTAKIILLGRVDRTKGNQFVLYKVCADNRSVSLERRRYITVGSRVNAHLEHNFLAFEIYCVKVNTDRPIL